MRLLFGGYSLGLRHGETTIDTHHLPGHPPSPFTGQKSDHGGDIIRFPQAPHWIALQYLGLQPGAALRPKARRHLLFPALAQFGIGGANPPRLNP